VELGTELKTYGQGLTRYTRQRFRPRPTQARPARWYHPQAQMR
jgi:hypothetical protein